MSACKTVYGGGCVCMSETELCLSVSLRSGVSGLRDNTLDLSEAVGISEEASSPLLSPTSVLPFS